MTAQKGVDLVLKIDISSTFTVIGGARANAITVNRQPVDVTTADSAGLARELLTASGVNSVSISASGLSDDDAAIGQLRTVALAGTLTDFQIIIPGSTSNGTYEGGFVVTSFSERANYDGAVEFDVTLESGDQTAFT